MVAILIYIYTYIYNVYVFDAIRTLKILNKTMNLNT